MSDAGSARSAEEAGICERIVAARDAGISIVRIDTTQVDAPEEAARRLGLGEAAAARAITEGEARAILGAVLAEDMAYSVAVVEPAEAARLAEAFVEAFRGEPARYFTNGTWRIQAHGRSGNLGLSGWTPATSATFDSGVLVVAATRIGCAWFMDED
jgi:hypothetical protein